jgi:hypothetical protein
VRPADTPESPSRRFPPSVPPTTAMQPTLLPRTLPSAALAVPKASESLSATLKVSSGPQMSPATLAYSSSIAPEIPESLASPIRQQPMPSSTQAGAAAVKHVSAVEPSSGQPEPLAQIPSASSGLHFVETSQAPSQSNVAAVHAPGMAAAPMERSAENMHSVSMGRRHATGHMAASFAGTTSRGKLAAVDLLNKLSSAHCAATECRPPYAACLSILQF